MATASSFGPLTELRERQLGFNEWAVVEWMGRKGMQWPVFLPLLFKERHGPLLPPILVVHLGSNDLGLFQGKALVLQARQIWTGL